MFKKRTFLTPKKGIELSNQILPLFLVSKTDEQEQLLKTRFLLGKNYIEKKVLKRMSTKGHIEKDVLFPKG